jgi:hypothetical protein
MPHALQLQVCHDLLQQQPSNADHLPLVSPDILAPLCAACLAAPGVGWKLGALGPQQRSSCERGVQLGVSQQKRLLELGYLALFDKTTTKKETLSYVPCIKGKSTKLPA